MSIRKKLSDKKTKLSQTKTKSPDHPANITDYEDGSFLNVDIELIEPNPDQPRKFFDSVALYELKSSIEQKGVLQPIIIRQNNDNKIYLIAGERRWRAAKLAGLEKIPAILSKGNPLEIALIENLQRENLRPVEEAEALQRMLLEFNYTQNALAHVIGKARNTVTEMLSLNKLPEPIKAECRELDTYPRRLLLEVSKQKSKKEMTSLFNKIKNKNLNSDTVRSITRTKTEAPKKSQAEIALEQVHRLINSILKIKLKTTDKDEKKQLMTALKELAKTWEKQGL